MSADIPIIAQHTRTGRERVIGQASDMASAERLLHELGALYASKPFSLYIDCSRGVSDVPTDALGFVND